LEISWNAMGVATLESPVILVEKEFLVISTLLFVGNYTCVL